MPNQLGLAGAQPATPTKYAAIYNPRWTSGIWTNRSPLRDATTTRQTEKFYGPSGDALIAGQNTEISEKLTLIRRPGNSIYGTDLWNSVDRFYDFRLFNAATEQITLMIDQADGLYSLNAPQNPAKTKIWTKSAGAGQTYMQSVGNTLFFGNGVDNKKWLQTLFKWTPNTALNTSTGLNPFLTTFLIDPNGNIQQLTAAVLPVAYVYVNNDTVQIIGNINYANVIAAGDTVTFPKTGMTATFLEGQTVTVVQVAGNQFTFYMVAANYAQTPETSVYATVDPGDGTPTTGTSQPAWSLTAPNAGNDFQGGTTIDGTAQWTNRGNPVENWGILMPTAPIVPVINGGAVVYEQSTYYSLVSCVIDSNGNLQQVTRAGLSGSATPKWGTTLGSTTLDGISAPGTSQGVIWTMIQSAAQMNWQANTYYPTGSFLIETASGTSCLFQSTPPTTPYLSGTVSAYVFPCPHSSGPPGDFGVGTWNGLNTYNGATNPSGMAYPTSIGSSAGQAVGLTGFDFAITPGGSGVFEWDTINSSGQVTGNTNPFPGFNENLFIVAEGAIEVPVAGNYTFTVTHGDGLVWGIGGGATFVSGSTAQNLTVAGSLTSINGFPIFPAGSNLNVTSNSGNAWIDTYTIYFPTAGTYPVEFNLGRWDKNNAGLTVQIAGNTIPSGQPSGGATSGSAEPTWPAWTVADAPGYPSVRDPLAGRLQWNNIGPAADYVWAAAQHFTLPNTTITDANNNIEAPYRTGYTAASGGAPTWNTALDGLTDDNPNLIWINLGTSTAPPVGTLTTATGWEYAISLVNTLDDTVSNATNLSAIVGPFTDATGVQIPAGAGLPPLNQIDPQADFVAIWRTTDGQNTPFLIPSTTTDYTAPVTISLHDYLLYGYLDTTPDTGLNNLISAPVLGENTPPAAGAINLTYYLNRIFYSIGATAYWTSGPNTPAGNGLNGSSPLNYDEQASLVSRLVPTTSGLFVFTVSDINIIQGNGTAQTPINPAVPLIEGVGLLSYNALDVNGSIIGFFSTDHQFLILDPSAGVTSAGYPLGDQFRLNNGQVGQSWDPSNVYVAWYVNGEDQGWYVGDGVQGWYRLMATPAPESGNYTWAPYAKIVAGVKALQSIETTPGNHTLLLGPVGTGNILFRDLNVNTDGGVAYPAYAVLGSCVLSQPGQYAVVPFITTESVGTGVPLVIGVLIDEALPYYKGPFETLKRWVNDPPNLKPSVSIPAQRFYLSDDTLPASMRSMQIQISWPAQNAPSELLTLTIFGGFIQEI
jgi:hypothetical protein